MPNQNEGAIRLSVYPAKAYLVEYLDSSESTNINIAGLHPAFRIICKNFDGRKWSSF